MQKEGLINGLIGQVRQSKGLVDVFAQKLAKRLKDIEAATQAKESKPEASEKVAEKTQTFSNGQNQNNNFRKFDTKPQNKFSQKPFTRPQNSNDKRDSFAKQPQGQSSSFNKGQNKKYGNNFVSTKTNNFRSFSSNDAPEIDLKAERNYTNKAKFAQKHSSNNEERKQQSKKSSSSRRNNILIEDENGFSFTYTDEYISKGNRRPVSLTLPITHVPYTSSVLFPFFDGLIPEGWLLDIAEQSWKISSRDRMALLLACCKDCIGDSTLLLDYGKF